MLKTKVRHTRVPVLWLHWLDFRPKLPLTCFVGCSVMHRKECGKDYRTELVIDFILCNVWSVFSAVYFFSFCRFKSFSELQDDPAFLECTSNFIVNPNFLGSSKLSERLVRTSVSTITAVFHWSVGHRTLKFTWYMYLAIRLVYRYPTGRINTKIEIQNLTKF